MNHLAQCLSDCLTSGVHSRDLIKSFNPETGRRPDGREPVLIGDKIMFVEPIVAARVHARKIELTAKSERINYELRDARIIRDGAGSQLAGWIGQKPKLVKW